MGDMDKEEREKNVEERVRKKGFMKSFEKILTPGLYVVPMSHSTKTISSITAPMRRLNQAYNLARTKILGRQHLPCAALARR